LGNTPETMSQSLCDRFGFDGAGISERLRMLGLTNRNDPIIAEEFQTHVVQPHIDAILDEFYEAIEHHPEFLKIVTERERVSHLRMTQRKYLLSLGCQFDTQAYFEERLRVGTAHQRVGVSLGLYQCFYCLLQNLLISRIPEEIKTHPDSYAELSRFILKITSLDMSLAIETYHSTEISTLEDSIDTIRVEGEHLRRTLQFDSLTRACSRTFLLQELTDKLASAKEESRPMSVVMADLDHFKDVNDKYGHLIGDHVLRDVATRMVTGARASDCVGRYGGEEFLIIFDNATLDTAKELAERIRIRIMADPFCEDSVKLWMTTSFGVAQARAEDTVETLTARADQAMYLAKKGGRNQVRTERELAGT
jgi:two-component system cell cycle response regulator